MEIRENKIKKNKYIMVTLVLLSIIMFILLRIEIAKQSRTDAKYIASKTTLVNANTVLVQDNTALEQANTNLVQENVNLLNNLNMRKSEISKQKMMLMMLKCHIGNVGKNEYDLELAICREVLNAKEAI